MRELAGVAPAFLKAEDDGLVLVSVALGHEVGSDRVQLVTWAARFGARLSGPLTQIDAKAGVVPEAAREGIVDEGVFAGPRIWIEGGAPWDLDTPSLFPEVGVLEDDMIVHDLEDAIFYFALSVALGSALRPDVGLVFCGPGTATALAWLEHWAAKLFPRGIPLSS